MKSFWKQRYIVDTRAADVFGYCKPSFLMGALQETSAEHMWYHKCGRIHLEEMGYAWIMAKQEYRLTRPIFADETLEVRSCMRKPGLASVYRDFEIYASGELCGTASNEWSIIDIEGRRIVKLTTVEPLMAMPNAALSEEKLGRIRPPVPMTEWGRRTVCYSDCDSNVHLNNTRYGDFVCDAMEYQNCEGWIDRFFIQFHREVRIGEHVLMRTGHQDDLFWVESVNDNGRPCFAAELHIAPPWTGPTVRRTEPLEEAD
ncbi:MAG: hypothetical protein IKD96_01410 [Oscillospiraceae bacterium]|nr:hypothetical protein [Oscillospiraceae bacterium]